MWFGVSGFRVAQGGGCRALYDTVAVSTWTPKVCRIIAFYGYWASILPTLGGLGSSQEVADSDDS